MAGGKAAPTPRVPPAPHHLKGVGDLELSRPKGSKIEKNQSRLIFSIESVFCKKINRFGLIFSKINRKKINRGFVKNQ